MTTLQSTAAQLLAKHEYPERIQALLQCVINGNLNSIARNEVLQKYNIRRITDIKEQTLDLILDYAEQCLEDGILTEEEMNDIRLLKIFFGIEEGDFTKNAKMQRVKNIITSQMQKLYADNKIDAEEALLKSDIQGLFGLGYSEYTEIVNQVARQALQRGADIRDLDTFIKPTN